MRDGTLHFQASDSSSRMWFACVGLAAILLAAGMAAWLFNHSLWDTHPAWSGAVAVFVLAFGYGASRGSRTSVVFVLLLCGVVVARGLSTFTALLTDGGVWAGVESLATLGTIPVAYHGLRTLLGRERRRVVKSDLESGG